MGLDTDYLTSDIPLDDWGHFEIPVKKKGAESDAGAQTCNTESGHLQTVESFKVSDKACFVSDEIVAVDHGGAQSGLADGRSTNYTRKPLISVKHKSLLSDGIDKSIATGIKSMDKTEGNSNSLTGQCLSLLIIGWVFMCLCLSVIRNNSKKK